VFKEKVQTMLDAGEDMPHGLLKWRSIEGGMKEAKESGKPLLYDLTAAWCGPCKRLVAEVFGNPDCAAMINKEFIPVQVVDRSRENGFNPAEVANLMEAYQLQYFPTLVVTMPGGNPEKISGFGNSSITMAFLVSSLGKVKGL